MTNGLKNVEVASRNSLRYRTSFFLEEYGGRRENSVTIVGVATEMWIGNVHNKYLKCYGWVQLVRSVYWSVSNKEQRTDKDSVRRNAAV